ncbi:MAG: PEP2-like protein [Hydrocarboniphaga sp.]|uniref:nuclear transport factor 2 family protein n=1 Tax=Hydrocarboniphaga sp. TaxID=2033016 RepID=UPI002604D3E2|nr:nuclear transport factor 2 family protein [Hydrocarboniphaga sp.]MDB5970000.1 PEP2-like protein [Hydrocarboniphaga sp.]
MKRLALLFLLLISPQLLAASQKTGDAAVTNSKAEIAELINSWGFYRDQEAWDDLLAAFTDDGSISLSWFDGPNKGFVAASKKLAEHKDNTVKHYIGVPMIKLNGDRAIAEENVTIMVRAKTPVGEIDTTSYARFYDYVVKQNGKWKILKRTAIYEKDRADAVDHAALPDGFYKDLGQYPAQFKFLAAALAKGGKSISPTAVLDKSPAMLTLYVDGQKWLAGD